MIFSSKKTLVFLTTALLSACSVPNVNNNNTDNTLSQSQFSLLQEPKAQSFGFSIKGAYDEGLGFDEAAYREAYTAVRDLVISDPGYYSALDWHIRHGLGTNRLSNATYTTWKNKVTQALNDGYVEEPFLMAFSGVNDLVKTNASYVNGMEWYIKFGIGTTRLQNATYLSKKAQCIAAWNAGYNEEAFLQAFPAIRDQVNNVNNDVISGLDWLIKFNPTFTRLQNQTYLNKKARIDQAINQGFHEEAYLLTYRGVIDIVASNNSYISALDWHTQVSSAFNSDRLTRTAYLSTKTKINPPKTLVGGIGD